MGKDHAAPASGAGKARTADAAGSPTTKANVLRIDGVYYDTEKLAQIHPGGPMMLRLGNQRECTAIFYSYHRRQFPHGRYTDFVVPEEEVDARVRLPPQELPNFDLYLQLCDAIKPVIAPTNGFAPLHYYLKVLLWVGLMVGLDLYGLFTWRPIYLTLLQSFAMAMVGMNVQHDANHGAVSGRWRLNRCLGLAQDWLGGSSISWILSHDYTHHIYTNEVDRDEDLDLPLLRLHHRIPLRAVYALQNLYVLLLEAVFGPVHVVTNVLFIWSGPGARYASVAGQWNVSKLLTLIVPLRILSNLLHAPSPGLGLLTCALQYMLGGLYLAFFFLLSHNFDGVEKRHRSDGQCFVKCQVETSSNFGGAVWAQLNGGLNYQIEHHLFPRVHHGYYPAIAPVVRAACAKHQIAYAHFPTIWDNVRSAYDHLGKLGRGDDGRGDTRH